MLFTFQADRIELESFVKNVNEVSTSMTLIAKMLGQKEKAESISIPTKSETVSGKWGRAILNISPEGLMVSLEVRPECTADFMDLYAKAYGMAVSPAIAFVVSIMTLGEQLKPTGVALAEKWFTKVETEEVKVEEAEAKAS